MAFKKNSKIQWKWLGRPIDGIVLEIYKEPVERVIKGKRIKRNGSPGNPAYLVQSKAGNEALKLGTELSLPDRVDKTKPRPKMFGD